MLAITREISPAFQDCQLTFLNREPIDLAKAHQQHANYEQALRNLGCTVETLPADPEFPDSVFVEDTAIVLDEIAVISRPGDLTRRGETDSIAKALQNYRKIVHLENPATLDGGDVLNFQRTLYVGVSRRTNRAGIQALRACVEPHGYRVQAVEVAQCLHLKTAVSQVTPDRLLLNREWVDPKIFGKAHCLNVASGEPMAANALYLPNGVIYPTASPRTRRILEEAGLKLHLVDFSEMAKAEAGATCCSLIFSR